MLHKKHSFVYYNKHYQCFSLHLKTLFAFGRGIEPLLTGWKPAVLTVRRTEHGV